MKQFGVNVKTELKNPFSDNSIRALDTQVTEEYIIPPGLSYGAQEFHIPGDFSTGALLLSAAILSKGNITLNGLNFEMPQGDMEIIEFIRKMGGQVMIDRLRGSVTIDGNTKLQGGIFDLKKTPDLLPVLAILSLVASGETRIEGVLHARFKETDRVANIASQLKRFGADVTEKEDSITIKPPQRIKSTSIESFNDHRLFMAFTIAGLATEGSIIEGAESVDVSYPGFMNDLKSLGADIQFLKT